jgi:hypothetical protein
MRSGARLIRDKIRHQPSRGEYDGRAAVHRRLPAVPCGHGESHTARSCRGRNAAARSRAHCRQRHRPRFGRFADCPASGVSLAAMAWISSRRILRRCDIGEVEDRRTFSTRHAPATNQIVEPATKRATDRKRWPPIRARRTAQSLQHPQRGRFEPLSAGGA